MSLDKIIGHENEKRILKSVVNTENLSHSYLFQGLDGIGKLKIAREFSKTLLCERHGDVYCDECSSCLKFDTNNHPDFNIILGEDRMIKKSEIDEIVDAVKHAPFESDKKIYIINNAHLMNKESQNGLLKTLEEPPIFLIIILITDSPNLLLPTIISRCQIINFNSIKEEEMKSFIDSNYNILDGEKEILLKLAKGSVGNLISMLEEDRILDTRTRVIDMIDKILAGDRSVIYNNESFFEENKENIGMILDIIMYWFRDLAIYKETGDMSYLINQDMEHLFRKQYLTGFEKIDKIISNVEDTRRYIRGNVNYLLSIEILLLNIGG